LNKTETKETKEKETGTQEEINIRSSFIEVLETPKHEVKRRSYKIEKRKSIRGRKR